MAYKETQSSQTWVISVPHIILEVMKDFSAGVALSVDRGAAVV